MGICFSHTKTDDQSQKSFDALNQVNENQITILFNDPILFKRPDTPRPD